MTTNSAIDTSNINENFPYPGISNDSQVFRDNFTAIKLSLNSAKDELEQFLTHGLRDDNLETNLNGNILSTCALRKTADYRHGITGLKDANFDLNYNNGQYQNVKIGADLTINLINFPTDTTDVKQVGKIRLQLSADATDRKVMFTAANAILKYDGEYPFVDSNKLTVKGSTGEDVTIIDIWQVNNGTLTPAIYFKYVGFFEYHTSPPATPTKYADDVGTIQNTNSTAITTDDTTPSIIVGARLSTIPKLYVDGLYKASTYNSSTGALSPRVALPEGTYEFAYTLSDSLGNESGLSAPLTITIDTTSPNAPPKPASFVDQVGYIQDMTSNELTTDNKRPGINIGVNLAGTPKLYIDGIRIDATYDTDSTIGTFTPDRDLADGGPYGFTYTLTDDAGNESAHSPVLSITIDTAAPPTPTVAPASYNDSVGSITNNSSTATITDDPRPGIHISPNLVGTARLYVNDVPILATYESDSTVGTLRPDSNLPDNTYRFSYTLTDSAGNESGKSPGITITVDTTPPVLQSAEVDATGLTLVLTYNETLSSTTAPKTTFVVNANGSPVTISSVAATESAVTLTLATAIQTGQTVTITYTAPQSGANVIKDTAGNPAISVPERLANNNSTVPGGGGGSDTTPPVYQSAAVDATGLSLIITYNEALSSTTASPSDFVVNVDSSPVTVSSVAASGNDVTLSLAVAVQQGQSVTVSYNKPSGVNVIKDTAGNPAINLPSTGVTNGSSVPGGGGGAVPTTPTSAPASYVDNSGPVTSDTSTASTTDDTTPGINIPTGLTDTVKLYNGNTYIPATYNPATGALTPNTALPDGNYDFKYTLSNQTGESGKSPAINITIVAIDGGWYATKQIPSRRDNENLASDRIYGVALLPSGNYVTVSTEFDMPNVFHGNLTYYNNNIITAQRNLRLATDLHCKSVAIDSTGNVYITGDAVYDGFVRKYNNTGTLIWAKTLDVSISDSWYKGYATVNVDNSDNMILVGTYGINATNDSGTNAGFIAKYNSSNVLQWTRSLLKSNENTHFAQGAITSSGAIGVVGYSGSLQYIIASYSNTGNLQWKRINTQIGTANITDVSIAADSNNNFYISGTKTSDGGVSPRNAFVVKYSPTGSLLWTKALSADSYFYAIDVDSSNIIHVVGSCDGGGLYATYDASGTLLSKRVFTNLSIFSDIKVDSSNVYISYNIFPNGLEYASGVITLDRVTGNNILGTTAVDITITDTSAITEFELTFTDTDATDLVSSPLTITSFPDDTTITQTTDIELTVTGGQAH